MRRRQASQASFICEVNSCANTECISCKHRKSTLIHNQGKRLVNMMRVLRTICNHAHRKFIIGHGANHGQEIRRFAKSSQSRTPVTVVSGKIVRAIRKHYPATCHAWKPNDQSPPHYHYYHHHHHQFHHLHCSVLEINIILICKFGLRML